jgi:hypothetical protein
VPATNSRIYGIGKAPLACVTDLAPVPNVRTMR